MMKLIAAAGFLVAVATSAHAITPAPIPQPDGMLSQVRLGCGPFKTVAGICVARTTIRHTRRLDRRAYRRGYQSSRTVQSRLHRLHCATDCAIQWVGLLSVASGKPTSVRNTLAPLRRGFFVSAIRHRNQRLGSMLS